jgi:hypothetical protein
MDFILWLLGLMFALIFGPLDGTAPSEAVRPPAPIYACDALAASRISGTEFRFETDATVMNGATIVSYTYDFGDGNMLTTNNPTVNHTYAQPGTYTVDAKVNIRVAGEVKWGSGPDCSVTLTMEAP